jgi:hypothetical protein
MRRAKGKKIIIRDIMVILETQILVTLMIAMKIGLKRIEMSGIK